jgi:hypothetical protein
MSRIGIRSTGVLAFLKSVQRWYDIARKAAQNLIKISIQLAIKNVAGYIVQYYKVTS